MRLDTKKLEAVREVVDLWLVEAALEGNLSRTGAAAAMADRVGFALRLIRPPAPGSAAPGAAAGGASGTWIVYAISRDVYRRALNLAVQGATISATGTELLEREPWHYESDSRDDAIVATLCRLVDENVDVDAGDGTQPIRGLSAAHGARYAAMGAWFEPVKRQWAKLAALQVQKA